jgi:hypothetical protein
MFEAKLEVLLVNKATVDVALDQSCKILLAKLLVLLVNSATVEIKVE